MACYKFSNSDLNWLIQVEVYLNSYVILIMKNKICRPAPIFKQIGMRISSLNLHMPLVVLHFLEVPEISIIICTEVGNCTNIRCIIPVLSVLLVLWFLNSRTGIVVIRMGSSISNTWVLWMHTNSMLLRKLYAQKQLVLFCTMFDVIFSSL